jgi:hypothetical protein
MLSVLRNGRSLVNHWMGEMEIFDIHITGDPTIHVAATDLGFKTITFDLLRPDGSVLRTEHMTSSAMKIKNFRQCLVKVKDTADLLRNLGVEVSRVKIESPYYPHYVKRSLYMECHYEADDFRHPTSRNKKKTTLSATDRIWDRNSYDVFASRNFGKDIEICLYDDFPEKDADWFEAYGMKATTLL